MMPRIGGLWEGHGGIYAGITRGKDGDFHLIRKENNKQRDLPYEEAFDWAMKPSAGFRDWRLPTRREAALLYANLQDQFEPVWYWTLDVYPPDNLCMWVQTFGYGRQADLRKTDGARACAVRTEPCE